MFLWLIQGMNEGIINKDELVEEEEDEEEVNSHLE